MKFLTAALMSSLCLFSLRAEAIVGGAPASAEGVGLVAFVGLTHSCTGVLIANDLILTAKTCFTSKELIKPELVGYFMGLQDSERNPSSALRNPILDIISHPTEDIAVVRLTRGLTIAGSTTGFHRPLFPLDTVDLLGRSVTCFGYGTVGSTTEYQYIGAPNTKGFTVANTGPTNVVLDDMSRFAPYDLGAACLTSVNGVSVVAGLVFGIANGKSAMVSAAAVRGWLASNRLVHELSPSGTEKVMTLQSPLEGSHVVLLPGTSTTDQRWELKANAPDNFGRTRYELRSRMTNRCLGVSAGSTLEGADVIQWTCGGIIVDPTALPDSPVPDQTWRIEALDHGYARIVNANSELCLDSRGGSISQFKCDNKFEPQRWRISAVFAADAEMYRLRSAGSVCAQPASASTSQIKSVTCNGNNAAQSWTMVPIGGPLHRVVNTQSGLVLDVSGAAGGDADLLQFTSMGTFNQRWRFDWRPGGYAIEAGYTVNMCASTPSVWGSTVVRHLGCSDPIVSNQVWWFE